MPKGEKLRPKQMDQPTTCEHIPKCRVSSFVFNQNKNVELEALYLIKTLLLQNCSLMGEKFHYGKKGELVAFDQIYSWNISLFAQTSVLDLEIGKRICFVKINQVVAKVIQICQILSEDKLVFKFALFENDIALLIVFNVLA
jgi:hypothetical protein